MTSSAKSPVKYPEAEANTSSAWQNFRRLVGYAKPYKLGFIVAILGMIGYATIDVYFLSQ